MKLSEEQKIAIKLGEFDPVAEILKDEQEKIASAIEKSSDYLDHEKEAFLGGLGARAVAAVKAQAAKPKPSVARGVAKAVKSVPKVLATGDQKARRLGRLYEMGRQGIKSGEDETVKEAQPPMGAPGMAAGGGAPQMMPGAMPQMGSPEMQAQQALMDAEAMKADPLEAQNETLRKVIQNQKLKLELAELSTKAQQAAMPPQVGPEAGPEAGGDGQMQGDPMEYMRQALSQ